MHINYSKGRIDFYSTLFNFIRIKIGEIILTKFLIIDGNSLGCRAAFAHNPKSGPDLHTQRGLPTGTIYRFINMFDRILHQIRPTHIVVAWDTDKNTFRKQLDPEYKANRMSKKKSNIDMDVVYHQFEVIRKILEKLGVKNVNVKGFEGDDICGTYATLSKADDNFIVTGDKDSFQLVNTNTTIVFPKNGFREVSLINEKYIDEHYGLDVCQFIDLKTLQGDKSDNIRGLNGCGEKTALKLLEKYGSAESIVKLNNDDLSADVNKKVLAGFDEWKSRFDMLMTLVTIRRDVPVEYTYDDCEIDLLNWEAAKPIFEKLELKNILNRISWTAMYAQTYFM